MDYTITLNNGIEMPRLGLGLYQASGEETKSAIADAVTMGYRLFDTASAYKNEEEVGEGIRSCGIPRDQLFVTTKIWNTAQRIGNVEGAFERSLDRLGLEIYKSGRVKAIGVSNFNQFQLDDLLMHSSIVPAVNQIEYHPLFCQDELRHFCQKNGIVVQAYSPLARGAYLDRDVLAYIAEKHHRSVAQVGLRWILQKGVCVIPKTVRTDRLLENSQIFDFELDEVEMATIDSLNENYRCASIPEDMQGLTP